jgi:hypothetical protein
MKILKDLVMTIKMENAEEGIVVDIDTTRKLDINQYFILGYSMVETHKSSEH